LLCCCIICVCVVEFISYYIFSELVPYVTLLVTLRYDQAVYELLMMGKERPKHVELFLIKSQNKVTSSWTPIYILYNNL
jgi:hypothetical protein